MLKQDAQTYAAIARLSRTQDGLVLLRVLENKIQSISDKLVDAPIEHVPVLQGTARALKDVRDLLRDAPEIAEKLKPR